MRIVLASDHAGFPLKEALKPFLASGGHDVTDVGAYSEEPVDYPVFCAAAARVGRGRRRRSRDRAGGSGQGEQIAANKVDGIRAALCHDLSRSRGCRASTTTRTSSAWVPGSIAPVYAEEIVGVWLSTPFARAAGTCRGSSRSRRSSEGSSEHARVRGGLGRR
mgnify:CR=1 FL=1